MRGAGCTYNDILDRDLDAGVERTRGRPLPSGRVDGEGGGGVPGRAGAGRPRGAALLQPLHHRRRPRLAGRRRGLSADEARDLVAAGGARPRLLLGRAGRLDGDVRRASPGRRWRSTPRRCAGRSATTRSTRSRTRATTPSSASARPRGCSARSARAAVAAFYAATAALAQAAILGAGGGAARARSAGSPSPRISRWQVVAHRRREPGDGAEAVPLQPRRGADAVRRARGAGRLRRAEARRPCAAFPARSSIELVLQRARRYAAPAARRAHSRRLMCAANSDVVPALLHRPAAGWRWTPMRGNGIRPNQRIGCASSPSRRNRAPSRSAAARRSARRAPHERHARRRAPTAGSSPAAAAADATGARTAAAPPDPEP